MTQSEVDQINDAFIAVHSRLAAIMQILTEKNVCTVEELSKLCQRWQPEVDQMFKEKADEQARQWREDNPEEANAVDFLNKIMGGRIL